LKIGIMGAGAVGCFVGGRLIAAGADVVLVGRQRLRDELAASGMTLVDLDEPEPVKVPAEALHYSTDPATLASCDAVLCCVKSGQTAEIAALLDGILSPDAAVASLQNGVSNVAALRAGLGDREVIPAIVSFNVVGKGDGVFHRATSGPLMLGVASERSPLIEALDKTGIDIETHANLEPHQWTKLVVNLSNAISALSGAPTRQLLLRRGFRKVIAALVSESLAVLRAASIKPARLRGIPLGVMPFVLKMPTPIVKLVTRRQMKVDPEARSSMWQDLERRRPTEVDYLNGEIVKLAERAGTEAPINRRIVELIHAAEERAAGSPNLDEEALWDALVNGSPQTASRQLRAGSPE
jgi:2-dehydropantoate 2-reductase